MFIVQRPLEKNLNVAERIGSLHASLGTGCILIIENKNRSIVQICLTGT